MDIRGSLAIFSPRVLRLLDLLLHQGEPVSVDSMAAALDSSRRTVFRDLEHIEGLLDQVQIVSVSGKGIRLECTREIRDNLAALLAQVSWYPGSRRRRLLCLLLKLLDHNGEAQKLFYYADSLGVSESTVSNDLDELEPWLKEHDILLVRRPGQGVYAEGREEDIRTAISGRLIGEGMGADCSYSRNCGFPGEAIEQGIRDVLNQAGTKLDWMTAESYAMFRVYLMVMVKRVKAGALLKEGYAPAGAFQQRLAGMLASALEGYFSLNLPGEERSGMALRIEACRSKQNSPLQVDTEENRERLQTLTCQMIERFDPVLAPTLLSNEQLIQGLSRHLVAAMTRLKKRVILPEPLEGQLAVQYPAIYQKSRNGAAVLQEYLHVPVPSSEVSLIAIHFLAALSAIGEKNIRKRVLSAGVVCAAGIGMSYMLASQVRQRFKGELEVEISGWDDREAWEKVDFIISTMPLENPNKPVIQVHLLLTEEDCQNIREAINAYAFVAKGAPLSGQRPRLPERLERIHRALRQVWSMLGAFVVESIAGDCSFEELAAFAAERFSSDKTGGAELYRALIERERVVTQVIAEMGIVLLHARSAGALAPVFALIVPEGGTFVRGYFRGVTSCVLMLVPRDCPPDITGIMGTINSALVDLPPLLEAVRRGDGPGVQALLETELSEVLAQYCTETLHG
ncbi:MAG: PRD domain-containing protein [Treponema sp.]|jgi:mannitol operon transcriptional antiterminator|nr:PRD domain-containing protein [Treponema sp.]